MLIVVGYSKTPGRKLESDVSPCLIYGRKVSETVFLMRTLSEKQFEKVSQRIAKRLQP